jgi:integrase
VRTGEARHLCLQDIDWASETISIRRPKQRKSQHYPLVRETESSLIALSIGRFSFTLNRLNRTIHKSRIFGIEKGRAEQEPPQCSPTSGEAILLQAE